MKKQINNSYYKLCIIEYLRLSELNQEQFEDFLKKSVIGYAKQSDVIKFMRKEIFPLKRNTIKWCLKYFDKNDGEVCYATILKKLKL